MVEPTSTIGNDAKISFKRTMPLGLHNPFFPVRPRVFEQNIPRSITFNATDQTAGDSRVRADGAARLNIIVALRVRIHVEMQRIYSHVAVHFQHCVTLTLIIDEFRWMRNYALTRIEVYDGTIRTSLETGAGETSDGQQQFEEFDV